MHDALILLKPFLQEIKENDESHKENIAHSLYKKILELAMNVFFINFTKISSRVIHARQLLTKYIPIIGVSSGPGRHPMGTTRVY